MMDIGIGICNGNKPTTLIVGDIQLKRSVRFTLAGNKRQILLMYIFDIPLAVSNYMDVCLLQQNYNCEASQTYSIVKS